MIPESGIRTSLRRKDTIMANESYEFSPEQNKLLKTLARLMEYTALVFLFLGVIIGMFCSFTITKDLIRGCTYLLLTIVAVTFGVWTNSVSYSFRQIVETKGLDINIMMGAFKTMKLVYILQFMWLLIITLLLLAVLILSTLFGFQSISIMA
jgi:hypothetical protein